MLVRAFLIVGDEHDFADAFALPRRGAVAGRRQVCGGGQGVAQSRGRPAGRALREFGAKQRQPRGGVRFIPFGQRQPWTNLTVKEIEADFIGGFDIGQCRLYLLLGVAFGVVLTRSEVVSWFRIQEMFRFQSFRMYGIFGSAIATAAASVALIKRVKSKAISGDIIAIPRKELGSGIRYGTLCYACTQTRSVRSGVTTRSDPGAHCSLVWRKTDSLSSLPGGLVGESLR